MGLTKTSGEAKSAKPAANDQDVDVGLKSMGWQISCARRHVLVIILVRSNQFTDNCTITK